jgi:hypothetical protein
MGFSGVSKRLEYLDRFSQKKLQGWADKIRQDKSYLELINACDRRDGFNPEDYNL